MVSIVYDYLLLLHLQKLSVGMHLLKSSRNNHTHYPNLHYLLSHLIKHKKYLTTTVFTNTWTKRNSLILEDCRNCYLTLVCILASQFDVGCLGSCAGTNPSKSG